MTRALALCLLLAAPAAAATWTSELPTTGSPCVEWIWRAVEPTGLNLFVVMTDSNWVTFPDPAVPLKVMCSCRDEFNRWSPWSDPSDPYFSPALVAQYARAGTILRVGSLSAAVTLIQSVDWVEPQ